MPYLTYIEFQDFGYEIDEVEFNTLLPRASDVLNNATRSFYEFNDIDKDVDFRRKRFKKAIASQIKYFSDMGATSSHDLNDPGHVQIGRTSVSTGGRNSNSNDDKQDKLVSEDALMYLRDTGLLYRGIGVRS